MKDNPNYYAVIPASVRYDDNLTNGAKLLYGEISALANKSGYCWATNEYFANLYKNSKISISRWITELNNAGHIELELDNGGRHIYIMGSSKMSMGSSKMSMGSSKMSMGSSKMSRGSSKMMWGVIKNDVGGSSKMSRGYDKNSENDGLTEPRNDDERSLNTTSNITYNNISVSPGKLKDNINLDKEKETDSTFEVTPTDEWGVPLSQGKKPKRKVERSEFIPTVFKLFGELLGQDGKFPSFWMFKPDFKDSAMRLEEERGMVAVKSALLFFKANRKNTYCPKVTNPQMLEEKWDDLLLFKNRKNEE